MSPNRNSERAPRRMRLERRMWLVLLVPIGVGLSMYGIAAHQLRHRQLMGEAAAELRNHATLVEAAVGQAVELGQLGVLATRLQRVARADRILGIAAFDAHGASILVTEEVVPATPELSVFAARALTGEEDIEERLVLPSGPVMARTVTFAAKSGTIAVVAVVVRDLRYVDVLASKLDRGLALTGLALLALTALVAAVASRLTVGRPAGAIVAGVERVAAGDLDVTVPERGAEEMARLARAFNAMTAALGEARAKARREEAARVAVERKIQHVQALAAVGQVAASIGHEIGSPLNVILGRARRAAREPACPDAIRGELETIAVQSERISRVVARLLAAARPARSRRDGSNLAAVARDVLAFLEPECRHRDVLPRFEAPDAAARVALDGDRLFQVIFNLALNAVQAQPGGGAIVVRVLPRAEGVRKLKFEIEDQGPGVAAEMREHLFEAFLTSRPDGGGTGLGLAVVSGILREAGGSVDLVATPHGGACFRIVLPMESVTPEKELSA